MTRLECAHESEFRALMRLRDLATRADILAHRLVGKSPNETRVRSCGDGSSNEQRPLVRAIEETSGYLHEAIDDIEDALDRLHQL